MSIAYPAFAFEIFLRGCFPKMDDCDCFFYKIRVSRHDAELIRQWTEARQVAQKIRESYDREIENKYALSLRSKCTKRMRHETLL